MGNQVQCILCMQFSVAILWRVPMWRLLLTLNVIWWPAGAIASSFHEIRRPKPATLMTIRVIYVRCAPEC